MKNPRDLGKSLRGLGQATSPGELQAKGVKRLRSFRAADLMRLVEDGIIEALQARSESTGSVSAEPASRGPLETEAGRVQESVRRRAGELQDIDQTLQRLERDAREHRGSEVEEAIDGETHPEEEIAELRDRLGEEVSSWAEQASASDRDVAALVARCLEPVQACLERREQRARRERQRSRARIEKLTEFLRTTESELQRARRSLGGLPSGFRASQRGEDTRERRRLLGGLLAENEKLQRSAESPDGRPASRTDRGG